MTGAPTTGTCAAAAAAAAAEHWLGRPCRRVEVSLPDLSTLWLDVEESLRDRLGASSVVRKPPNEDPDATRSLPVRVRIVPDACRGIRFVAGDGVGVVTRPGLRLAPGEPAINPVPREQIGQELVRRGISDCMVVVSVIGGREVAVRTFNERLGIRGGISILGTSGQVRPFSSRAVVETVCLQLDVACAAGWDRLCLVPGHLGRRAALGRGGFLAEQVVEVSNAWGEALDHAARIGCRALVLSGHPGKLAKLAQGQWNTHSSEGSSALEWTRRLALREGLPASLEATTVDGLFLDLEGPQRRCLGDSLAALVARAASQRSGVACEVVLTGYDGEVFGAWGNP